MLSSIRKSIGKRRLRKEMSRLTRERRLTNLSDARKIGILYTLDEPTDYDTVAEFVQTLQHDRKEVKALGFVRNRKLAGRFLPKLSFDFFSPREVNFFYKPVSPKVTDFIHKEFDLMIDLCLEDNLAMQHISGFSAAHCRVGRLTEDRLCCYDLMIDLRKGMTLREFILAISHYLTIINSNAGKTE